VSTGADTLFAEVTEDVVSELPVTEATLEVPLALAVSSGVEPPPPQPLMTAPAAIAIVEMRRV